MKKITYFGVVAAAVIAMVSCNKAPKASLKTDVDTLSYAVGVTLGDEFIRYDVLNSQMGVDSAYINAFIKGVVEAASAKDNKEKAAYYAGLQIGQQIVNQIQPNVARQFFGEDTTKVLNSNNLISAFVKKISNDTPLFTSEQADSLQKIFTTRLEELKRQQMQANIEAGKAFLAENAKKEGVQVTESGLQYKVIKQGTGATPTAEDKVRVHYAGKLIDGTEFDSSYSRGDEPATFKANQVIPGWTEALCLMPVGSKWELYIPQELAYGEREMGNIKPGSVLIFTVELVDIVKE